MLKKIIIYSFFLLVFVFILSLPKEEVLELKKASQKTIEVEITGYIKHPGKYIISTNSTLHFLIELAGGLLSEADIRQLNLKSVVDKKSYYIKKYEIKTIKNEDIKHDINLIKYDQLIKIPNINEEKAINILSYRSINKRINSLDELRKIKKIGQKTYEKIKKYFYI